ncbi:hypothetical protein OG762_24840 [Streptomyces sp. NBC_01136]|uniref:hypothetical protein n=1 Tax=unclassified Streptomyces TaxID=2593676 RepID=UPI00324C737D|nr:hypothetical protein OG762_24840 [Streptomyces sp. NBC_01136]
MPVRAGPEPGEYDPETGVRTKTADKSRVSKLLGIPPAGLTDVYPPEDIHAAEFRRLTGIGLELDRYEYFLDVEADRCEGCKDRARRPVPPWLGGTGLRHVGRGTYCTST